MRADSLRLIAVGVFALSVPSHGVCQSAVGGTVRNGGSAIGDAAVYLTPLGGAPVAAPRARASVDQVHLQFVPPVSIVTPGTELSFLNSDDVLHNVFGPGLGGTDQFDLGTYPRGDRRSWVFEQQGLHVVLCHIHPEMAAYIIVAPTPFSTLSDQDGTFRIEGVPPGLYELRVWHVRHWRSEHSQEITVGDGDVTGLVITLGGNRAPTP